MTESPLFLLADVICERSLCYSCSILNLVACCQIFELRTISNTHKEISRISVRTVFFLQFHSVLCWPLKWNQISLAETDRLPTKFLCSYKLWKLWESVTTSTVTFSFIRSDRSGAVGRTMGRKKVKKTLVPRESNTQ